MHISTICTIHALDLFWWISSYFTPGPKRVQSPLFVQRFLPTVGTEKKPMETWRVFQAPPQNIWVIKVFWALKMKESTNRGFLRKHIKDKLLLPHGTSGKHHHHLSRFADWAPRPPRLHKYIQTSGGLKQLLPGCLPAKCCEKLKKTIKITWTPFFEAWTQKLIVSSGARGNSILKFGNSRFFRFNVGRWQNMISDVFREACFPSLDSINQVFCWEKKQFQSFFGGESCFYTTLPMKSHYPPPKAVGKLSFLYQLVEYVRVTLWHPSKALGCRHWRRASKLHMLVRYNQTIPKPWLVGVWFSFTIYRFIKLELVRSCQIGKKNHPQVIAKKKTTTVLRLVPQD